LTSRTFIDEEIDMTEHDASQLPTPDPALRRLDFLVGSWKVDGATYPSSDEETMPVTGTYSFEWLHGGFFLVQRWDNLFGSPSDDPAQELPGGPVQKGIMFYGYDAPTKKYRTHFFDGNGPFHEGSMYEGEVVDGNLRFTGPARFTVIANEDGTITNEWELRDESGDFVPWMRSTLTRLA